MQKQRYVTITWVVFYKNDKWNTFACLIAEGGVVWVKFHDFFSKSLKFEEQKNELMTFQSTFMQEEVRFLALVLSNLFVWISFFLSKR